MPPTGFRCPGCCCCLGGVVGEVTAEEVKAAECRFELPPPPEEGIASIEVVAPP